MNGNSYYDIDNIITDGIKVRCKFSVSLPGVGYLESPTQKNENSHDNGLQIKEGSVVELPLWIGSTLALSEVIPSSGVSFVNILIPHTFSQVSLNALKTDPISVDLKSLSPQFYRLALKWLQIFSVADPLYAEEAAKVILETLQKRLPCLSDHSNNIYNASFDQSEMISKLDDFELQLLKRVHGSNKEICKWLSRE